MRIISQDGTLDVPYENTVLYQDEKEIMCIFEGIYIGRKLAQYCTTEKAEKAMEMLREKYKDFARATDKSHFFTMFDYPKVFQFPKDEDVEVQDGQ